MQLSPEDTIAATASPAGPGERAIVRVSGPNVADVIDRVFLPKPPAGHRKSARGPRRWEGTIVLPGTRVQLPVDLMYWPGRRSYTGQPMAELHLIGCPPLADAVLKAVLNAGARHAHRGEFTLRAFLAGRIDLVQAEGVLGVIDAADHEELQAALKQLGGGVTTEFSRIRSDILALLGDLEAGLDFVEEDIEFISRDQVCQRLEACRERLEQLRDTADQRLPSGYRRKVVLAGLPNAGKSTLFNAIVGRQQAIVSPVAGTTRDFLSAIVDVDGIQVEFVDTAGWEETSEYIMSEAQLRRGEQLTQSDIVLWCRAACLDEASVAHDRTLRARLHESRAVVLEVTTQADRLPRAHQHSADMLAVSAQTGTGIQRLMKTLRQTLTVARAERTALVASTAARCSDSLHRAIAATEAAIAAATESMGDEIVALELRTALHEIGVILGEVYTDDILDHIFSNFCIGK